ncbi:MAG TPA: PadR family transcriptional regulator [Solirubrobacteraceae bacterium]|nr:PadR family transcriptional regulator [Solirubrobacteraceae bacterium]
MPNNPKPPQPSPLGLIVLWQLWSEPMHVYRLQKLLEAEGKDRIVNVRSRASLYQAIERLERLGLVEVSATVRQEGYPDRVVYAITDAGRLLARQWLREMLSDTGGRYPEFIVALSILFALPVTEAREQLELRAERLAEQLAETERTLSSAPPGLPRLFLLEEEYRRTLLHAEIDWLRGVIADLTDGRLTWSEQWLREIAEAFLPTHDEHDEHDEVQDR